MKKDKNHMYVAVGRARTEFIRLHMTTYSFMISVGLWVFKQHLVAQYQLVCYQVGGHKHADTFAKNSDQNLRLEPKSLLRSAAKRLPFSAA
uniref:Uncharacterized protein n=1 Tax=Romanomermis culicivorax TaxID=13658 RepID=A0A915J4F0_ROMCU